MNFKEQLQEEDGSLFEKIIAECIAGIAQSVLYLTTDSDLEVGFKDYDELIFNRTFLGITNEEVSNLAPFDEALWTKTMRWYRIFGILATSLILIGVIVLSYNVTMAGINTAKKNEAKESLMRLFFGGVAIALAPMFIKFLLFLNNSLIKLLLLNVNGSLNGVLGNNMLKSIRTGNAIVTALVIAMFIYLFVKINIKFIVRQFTLIIFIIFTPIACGLWIINKNVTAASIWAGQIIINIFMQFIYCFLFLVYLEFLPSAGGWAISLIWAMMLLPLADALQNCLQNLTSRIAGLDNETMSNKVVGMGAMLGFSANAIKQQFVSPENNVNGNSGSSNSGLKGFIGRAKSVINPSINLSDEKDYNGNINPIRNVIPKEDLKVNNNINSLAIGNNQNTSNSTTNMKSVAGKVLKTGANATKAYLSIGAKLAEGDFSKSPFNNNQNSQKKKLQNTEIANEMVYDRNFEKLGDDNEHKG